MSIEEVKTLIVALDQESLIHLKDFVHKLTMKKRGRKIKYRTEEDRKANMREYMRNYMKNYTPPQQRAVCAQG
jgi:hypothetical protein